MTTNQTPQFSQIYDALSICVNEFSYNSKVYLTFPNSKVYLTFPNSKESISNSEGSRATRKPNFQYWKQHDATEQRRANVLKFYAHTDQMRFGNATRFLRVPSPNSTHWSACSGDDGRTKIIISYLIVRPVTPIVQ
jgi:hypothetical protein